MVILRARRAAALQKQGLPERSRQGRPRPAAASVPGQAAAFWPVPGGAAGLARPAGRVTVIRLSKDGDRRSQHQAACTARNLAVARRRRSHPAGPRKPGQLRWSSGCRRSGWFAGVDPSLEHVDLLTGPGSVAGHRAGLQPFEDGLGVLADVGAGTTGRRRTAWIAGPGGGTAA